MLNFVFQVFNAISPQEASRYWIKRAQIRALEPTWPVPLSILAVIVLMAASGQGRALVRYTVSSYESHAGFSPHVGAFLLLLVLFSLLMMILAFMLSAVTRRAYIREDIHEVAGGEGGDQKAVDPSIGLRLQYAYISGLALPVGVFLLTYSLVASPWVVVSEDRAADLPEWLPLSILPSLPILTGALIAGGFCLFNGQLARWCDKRLAHFNGFKLSPAARRIFGWPVGFAGPTLALQFWRLISYFVSRRHQLSNALLLFMLVVLLLLEGFWGLQTVMTSSEGSENLPPIKRSDPRAFMWTIFLSVWFIDLVAWYAHDKHIRLHNGHDARYIIIDRRAEAGFRWGRRIGIFTLPLLLWWWDFVDLVNTLGTALIGMAWLTLVMSWVVERAVMPFGPEGVGTLREKTTFSLRSKLFIGLLSLLFVDVFIGTIEGYLFPKLGAQTSLLPLLPLLAMGLVLSLLMSKSVRQRFGHVPGMLNRLATPVYLSPFLIFGLGEAHHIHRIQVSASELSVENALPIHTHAEQWLSTRISAATQQGDMPDAIPAIVVLAEGGGIRAANHSALFLSHLDEALREACQSSDQAMVSLVRLCRSAPTRLLDHVYVMSGVSGGAVGISTYLAALAEEQQSGALHDARHVVIRKTLQSDFMSVLVAGIFGGDFITSMLPVQLGDRAIGLFHRNQTDGFSGQLPSQILNAFPRGIHDRADRFETRLASVFEREVREAFGREEVQHSRIFDLSLETVTQLAAGRNTRSGQAFSRGLREPVVMFSTFSETDARLMVASNVDFLQDTENIDEGLSGQSEDICPPILAVQQLIDVVRANEDDKAGFCQSRQMTLPLSTAAHVSARFPVSNPTGVVETRTGGVWTRHHFVDGGYLDNSGAVAALEALEHLVRARRKLASACQSELNDCHEQTPRLDVMVLHIFAKTVPQESRVERANTARQEEFTKIANALLKARGVSGHLPVENLCRYIFDRASEASGRCAMLRVGRVATPDELEGVYTEENFSKARLAGEPTQSDLVSPISDFALQEDLIGATWVPVPLEVAQSDRQSNARYALLGWTLTEATADHINNVMKGTALRVCDTIIGGEEGVCDSEIATGTEYVR